MVTRSFFDPRVRVLGNWLAAPIVTRKRKWAALSVAIATDLIQLILGPLGWVVIDDALDVVAMFVISRLIGFHYLLLPTLVLELVPVADLLPGWTACTLAVAGMRKRPR